MVEQKGRGGKKPKYQIADIGGSDRTSQDLSTERVLNFLIKGEAPANQEAGAAGEELNQADSSPGHPKAGGGQKPGDDSLPSPGTQVKKSLDHLFRRASAGGTAARNLKLDLRRQEDSAQAAQPTELKTVARAEPAPPAVPAEAALGSVVTPPEPAVIENRPVQPPSQPDPHVEPDTSPQAASTQELTPEITSTTRAESAELTQLISLWKSFYRLKDGEIEALSALYRMSHGQGAEECYVKMHKLAEMSNLTYRYCQKVVRSLENLGWLTKLQDYDPTTQLGVLYRVNLKPSV